MKEMLDHAASLATRQFVPLQYTFESVLTTHLSTAAYLAPPPATLASASSKPLRFHHNNSVWEQVIRTKKLHHGSLVLLDSFFVFEWFPRSPGLFWTDQGRYAREDARRRIITASGGVVVYDPHGKQSMLDGGVGNIRLNPIHINGVDWVLMSASDNGTCHEGFPIALPKEFYIKYIDEIRARGAIVRTLSGELKMIPKELSELYHGYAGVPKLYLQVTEIGEAGQKKSLTMEGLEVSVAISFKGKVDGELGIYASYVTFDPNRHGSFERAVSWMGDKYVSSYDGVVLTDFDEQENHFPEARFSLQKVMHLNVTKQDFSPLDGTYIGDTERYIINQQNIYNISESNIGAVGDNARAEVTQTLRVSARSTKRTVKKRR